MGLGQLYIKNLIPSFAILVSQIKLPLFKNDLCRYIDIYIYTNIYINYICVIVYIYIYIYIYIQIYKL